MRHWHWHRGRFRLLMDVRAQVNQRQLSSDQSDPVLGE